MQPVARHRTALTRTQVSRPLALALEDGLIEIGDAIFDYGCGRGDDVRHLSASGYTITGWDPVHRPRAPITPADVVNLGYVINVIENRDERADVLRRAWSLASKVLVVSARLTWEARDLAGRRLEDGILTSAGTFQKFFEHAELAGWIEQCVGQKPVAAGPGIFYVVRDPALIEKYLANRVRSYQPRIQIEPHLLYQAHEGQLAPLLDFMLAHGRGPKPLELPAEHEEPVREAFGTLVRAASLVRKVIDDERWQDVRARRRHDLLVYVALSRFGRRPKWGHLPGEIALDIRAIFGTYQEACAQADRLLFAIGRRDLIVVAARSSVVGKRTPSALYVHRSILDRLPLPLRIFEGCARVLAGSVEGANIVKLSVELPQVSYLAYPRFEREAHPRLVAAVTVNLDELTVAVRSYIAHRSPPVLHRKEDFVGEDDPRRSLYARLTAAEVRAGLFEHPEAIGTVNGWRAVLDRSGLVVRGHRLVKVNAAACPPGAEVFAGS